jgi:hypothetical protein
MELIVIVVTVTVTVLLLTRVLMNRYADDEDNPIYMCVLCWMGCFRDSKSLVQHHKLSQTGIAPANKSDLNMLSGNVTFVSVVAGDKIAITTPGPVVIESARQRLYSIDEENPPGKSGVVGVNAPGQVSAVGDDALGHKQHPGGFDSSDFAYGDKSSSDSEWGLYDDAEDADGTSILDSSVGDLGGGRVGGNFSDDDDEEEDVVTQQFLRNIIISANHGSEDSDNDDDIGEKHGLFNWGVNTLHNQEDSSSDSDDATTANFMRNLTIVSDDSGNDDDVDGGGGSSQAEENADDASDDDCDTNDDSVSSIESYHFDLNNLLAMPSSSSSDDTSDDG